VLQVVKGMNNYMVLGPDGFPMSSSKFAGN
jgi:hypothetical protein